MSDLSSCHTHILVTTEKLIKCKNSNKNQQQLKHFIFGQKMNEVIHLTSVNMSTREVLFESHRKFHHETEKQQICVSIILKEIELKQYGSGLIKIYDLEY